MTQEELFQAILLYASDHKAGAWVFENSFSATTFALRKNITELIDRITETTLPTGAIQRRELRFIFSDAETLVNDLQDIELALIQTRMVKFAPERSKDLTGELLRVVFEDFRQGLVAAIDKVKEIQKEDQRRHKNDNYETYEDTILANDLSDYLVDLGAKIAKLDESILYAETLYTERYGKIVK